MLLSAVALLASLAQLPVVAAAAQTTVPTSTPSAPSALSAPAARADSGDAPIVREATAKATFDFGGGSPESIDVRSLELAFTNGGAVPVANGSERGGRAAQSAAAGGSAQARFLKEVGPLTPELTRRGATGARLPAVTLDVVDGAGRAMMRVRLSDVVVTSDRIVVEPVDPGLQQRRLDLQEAIAAVSVDLQEAQRQLTLTDVLDKRRLSASQDVVRARERVDLLTTRLEGQKRRLAMLDRQIERQAPVREEVVLSFARFEVETP